ncbi:MAG: hypothetical protein JRH15_22360 [Deltaproteobacteria bacterium]|nr:hypothetical protein [Deltaproteobacteria bacterium]
MRKIKKYANRKMYDTVEKQYISLDQLAELIKAGEEVVIMDNQTGQDITVAVLSQLLAREQKGDASEEMTDILSNMLRKGSTTVLDYAKRYSTRWQSAMSKAEDEIDKMTRLLFKGKDVSEDESNTFKKDMLGHVTNLKNWMGEKIDRQIREVLSVMNLATREDIKNLIADVVTLERRLNSVEARLSRKSSSDAGAEKTDDKTD